MTSYENIGAGAFRGHAVRDRYNSQWYSYDTNGNMTALWTSTGWQNMSWDHENRLSGVSGASLPTESYLYDTDGQRVRKTNNGVNAYYINQYYEVSGSTITKYYYFNGQRVAIRTNALGGWTHHDLHGDHLGSTVFMTNQGLTYQSSEGYYAYGPGGPSGAHRQHPVNGSQVHRPETRPGAPWARSVILQRPGLKPQAANPSWVSRPAMMEVKKLNRCTGSSHAHVRTPRTPK